MARGDHELRPLVLGLGNLLLSDDGFGVHVTRELASDKSFQANICDGGTCGMSLLPAIEDADCLIVVDAMELGEAPGTLRTFQGEAFDDVLGGNKKTAHEVALADLMSAARLTGHVPQNRLLVAAQPASTEWGLEPGEPVQAAIGEAVHAVRAKLEEWRHG